MNFIQLWLTGYINPARLIEGLRAKPAPHYGFFAQLLRGGLVGLFLYLPLAVLGRTPPTPSYIPAFPTGTYYGTLVWLAPLVLTADWLIGGAFLHIVLRLARFDSDLDQILNITGMAALVTGTLLLGWDWLWIAIGTMDQIALGLSHLALDIWAIVIVVTGLHRTLGVPAWLGAILSLSSILVPLPLAIMFMRSPL